MILGSFGNGTVNKTRQYFLAILLCLLIDHSVMIQWIKPDTIC